jgi:hypothetical protein
MSKYEIVKEFYNAKLWSVGMVWNAVERWITEKEYLEYHRKGI